MTPLALARLSCESRQLCYNGLKEPPERLTLRLRTRIVLGVVITRFSNGSKKFGHRRSRDADQASARPESTGAEIAGG